MALTGAIAAATQSKITQAWLALLAQPGYGESGLNRSINVTKYLLFNVVVDPLLEETTYNPLVIEYCSLLSAARILTSAAEVMNNASSSRTMFGDKNQQESYLNRYENLLDLRKRYLEDAEALLPRVKDDLSPGYNSVPGSSPLGYYEGLDNAVTEDANLWDYKWDDQLTKYPVDRNLK